MESLVAGCVASESFWIQALMIDRWETAAQQWSGRCWRRSWRACGSPSGRALRLWFGRPSPYPPLSPLSTRCLCQRLHILSTSLKSAKWNVEQAISAVEMRITQVHKIAAALAKAVAAISTAQLLPETLPPAMELPEFIDQLDQHRHRARIRAVSLGATD